MGGSKTLKQTYYAHIIHNKHLYPKDAFYFNITTNPRYALDKKEFPNYHHYPQLGHDKAWLVEVKENGKSWEWYEKKFREKMQGEIQQVSMKAIKTVSEKFLVFIYCLEKPPKPCHRYIIFDLTIKM